MIIRLSENAAKEACCAKAQFAPTSRIRKINNRDLTGKSRDRFIRKVRVWVISTLKARKPEEGYHLHPVFKGFCFKLFRRNASCASRPDNEYPGHPANCSAAENLKYIAAGTPLPRNTLLRNSPTAAGECRRTAQQCPGWHRQLVAGARSAGGGLEAGSDSSHDIHLPANLLSLGPGQQVVRATRPKAPRTAPPVYAQCGGLRPPRLSMATPWRRPRSTP